MCLTSDLHALKRACGSIIHARAAVPMYLPVRDYARHGDNAWLRRMRFLVHAYHVTHHQR